MDVHTRVLVILAHVAISQVGQNSCWQHSTECLLHDVEGHLVGQDASASRRSRSQQEQRAATGELCAFHRTNKLTRFIIEVLAVLNFKPRLREIFVVR